MCVDSVYSKCVAPVLLVVIINIICDIVEVSMLINFFTSSDHLFMCSIILLLCKNDN